MTCEGEAIQLLRQHGYRITPQRALILRALRHARGHVTASAISRQVREQFPTVNLSTVYRTLALLKELRLVTETDLGAGDAMYEWSTDRPHHHLVCTECNRIQVLPHDVLAALAETLAGRYGFRAHLDHFAIFGRCRECQPHGGENGDQG